MVWGLVIMLPRYFMPVTFTHLNYYRRCLVIKRVLDFQTWNWSEGIDSKIPARAWEMVIVGAGRVTYLRAQILTTSFHQHLSSNWCWFWCTIHSQGGGKLRGWHQDWQQCELMCWCKLWIEYNRFTEQIKMV